MVINIVINMKLVLWLATRTATCLVVHSGRGECCALFFVGEAVLGCIPFYVGGDDEYPIPFPLVSFWMPLGSFWVPLGQFWVPLAPLWVQVESILGSQKGQKTVLGTKGAAGSQNYEKGKMLKTSKPPKSSISIGLLFKNKVSTFHASEKNTKHKDL